MNDALTVREEPRPMRPRSRLTPPLLGVSRWPSVTPRAALGLGLGLASALALAAGPGCATTSGARASGSLAGEHLAKLEVSLVPADGLCPGFSGQLRVVAVTRDGRRLVTPTPPPKSAGGPTPPPKAGNLPTPSPPAISWANFDVAVRGGTASSAGRVRLTAPARRLLRRAPEVTVTSIHHPTVAGHLMIPVAWGCSFTAHFEGRPGHAGRAGRPGLSVEGTLSVLEAPDGRRLGRLVLRAPAAGRAGELLFDPHRGGAVLISARGGAGGRGLPGHDGGPGGHGGVVHLTIDPAAQGFAGSVRVDTRGGDGGLPGDPQHAQGAPGPDGPAAVLRPGAVWEP